MLKKTIKYDNPLTGQPETEEHYFHISKADLIKLEMGDHDAKYTDKTGTELTGIVAKLQRIVDAEDGKAIIENFEDLLRISYGIKDGDKFRKSPQISADFMSTEAYSQFFWDICTNAEEMAAFINGVIPKNLNEVAEEVTRQAELRAKGIAAQAEAKAAAPSAQVPTPPQESAAVAAVEQVADATGSDFPKEQTLAERIEAATAENPAVLTPAEIGQLDSDELKSGLATGRIKLS